MERPKILCIEWIDPDTRDGWKTPEDVVQESGSEVVSVGMLMHEDDDTIILCMDWAKDGDVNSRGRISKALVTKRKEIPLPAMIWKELKRTPSKKKEQESGKENN